MITNIGPAPVIHQHKYYCKFGLDCCAVTSVFISTACAHHEQCTHCMHDAFYISEQSLLSTQAQCNNIS